MEPIMIWLILLIVFIGIEVATMGLTTIWFAGGALFAILAAVLQAPVVIQFVLFILVSLLLLFFTRPVAVKYFNKDRVRTNVESMVGRQAIVTSEIDNIQAMGQVTVSGQEWSARSCDNNMTIPVGAIVKIMAINGVKLMVMPQLQNPGAEREDRCQAQTDARTENPSDTEEAAPEEQGAVGENTVL